MIHGQRFARIAMIVVTALIVFTLVVSAVATPAAL